MKEFVHSNPPFVQGPTESEQLSNKSSSKETNTRLKLVVSNPEPLQETLLSQKPNFNVRASFTAEVRVKGPYLYEMMLRDPSCYLACNLCLEVEESNRECESRAVICYFPTLSDRELNNFIEEDDILHGALIAQFKMKILEQLFLFCATHHASTLIIFADDTQADDLSIYQDFLAYDQKLTSQGKKTEMVILTNQETFEAWVDFMQKATVNFHQTLWREQGTNPAIRRYLKMQCSRSTSHEG